MNLKTGVSRKQSTPNFPKKEHFLPPDTHIAEPLIDWFQSSRMKNFEKFALKNFSGGKKVFLVGRNFFLVSRILFYSWVKLVG